MAIRRPAAMPASPATPSNVSAADLATLSTMLSDTAPPEAEACVLEKVAGDADLIGDLVAAETGEITDLPVEDQEQLFRLVTECVTQDQMAAFLNDDFDVSPGDELPPEVVDCLAERLTSDEGPITLVGLSALDADLPVPTEARQPVIDTMTDCVSPSALSGAVLDGATDDPELAGALDETCVADAYDQTEDLEPLWTAWVDNPNAEFEDLPPEATALLTSPILGCFSFGQVIATQFATTGGEISPESISCIDDRFIESGLIDQLLAGEEPDEATAGLVFIECLTAEELSLLTGAG